LDPTSISDNNNFLPPTPPNGFPMNGSAGNIYVYADCKNIP
jgi:hypothetical protein